MKIKNYAAAFSVAAVLAVTGAVTSPVWAGDDGHGDECAPSSSSSAYCPDESDSPYPSESPTDHYTTPPPTTTPPTTTPPTTPPTTTPPPTTPPTTTPPTTPPTTTPPPTTPPTTPPPTTPTTPPPTTPTTPPPTTPTTPAPTTPAPTTPASTPTTTVSPSIGATNSPGGGGGGEVEIEVLGEQASTGPVVQQDVPTSINAGLPADSSDENVGLPLGLATLGMLLGLVALVLRRRRA